jgi:GNAT superfamily N-acetyltransferase
MTARHHLGMSARHHRNPQIGVSEAYQGQGIGSALLAHAFKSASAVDDLIGAMWMFLEAINVKSEAFYSEIGFKWFNQNRKEMIIPIAAIKALVVNGEQAL